MVVSDYRSKGAVRSRQRGIDNAANSRRGVNMIEYGEIAIPFIERISASQFERWLVQKFGPEYLQPVYLYKDGGGI